MKRNEKEEMKWNVMKKMRWNEMRWRRWDEMKYVRWYEMLNVINHLILTQIPKNNNIKWNNEFNWCEAKGDEMRRDES